MESPTLEVTVTMAMDPAIEVAMISTVVASALVVVSSAQLTSSTAGRASNGLRLDDVVLQFYATHRLSELTESWGRLAARAASFGEQLQVVIFFFLVFVFPACFTLFSYFLLFLWEYSFSWDHSSFFGSGDTEKKLSFVLSQLKAQLASKEVELDSECQGRQDFERVLCAQIIEAEQRRD
jgi:hypothetical protein